MQGQDPHHMTEALKTLTYESVMSSETVHIELVEAMANSPLIE